MPPASREASFPSQKYELILFYSRKKTMIPIKSVFSDCFFVFLFDIQIYYPIFVALFKGNVSTQRFIPFFDTRRGFRWLPSEGESNYFFIIINSYTL